MKQVTKEEFYRERAKTYPLEDPEALIRYQNAIDWIDLSNKKVVVREVGCKFAVIRDLLDASLESPDYIAIDIDEPTLKKIPRYTPNQFIQHNANNGLPFADATVDYLVCLEVLEHLEDATKFFKEAFRVLKKNGRLILSVPNPYSWMELIGNMRKDPDIEGHIATYSFQNINALCQFCGFNLCDMEGTFTRLPFSRKLFGSYKLIKTKNIFMTRSFMFLLEKSD
jgi:SAM-dependent methyltransferase